MRMRKRPNLAPRMEKCAELLISSPEEYKGKWAQSFPGFKNIYLEIGCGKGRFTAETAANNPDTLYIALEKVPDAMIIAMERVRARELKNVYFIDGYAEKLLEMFEVNELSRIYINFCDPWPKSRDAKFRLTAPGLLRLYSTALCPGGEIHFKTDNTPLFDWSVEKFNDENWELHELTHDLHANGPVGVMTDYEAKFYAEGLKINRLVAKNVDSTKDISAGPVARMRNAALTDAKGYRDSQAAHARETEK